MPLGVYVAVKDKDKICLGKTDDTMKQLFHKEEE